MSNGLLKMTVAGCLALTACGEPTTLPQPSTPLNVIAVNYPLAFFAQRIGGEYAQVTMPVPLGIDPADWQPSPTVISEIQSADAILLNGAGYATWTNTASLPAARTHPTSIDARDEWITIEGGAVHTHGPDGNHSHANVASTTWLDPEIAIAQVDSVRKVFVALSPEYQETFNSNARALMREIIDVSGDLEQAVNAAPGKPILFSHPVYQYLIRRFGINARSVHWEPDEMPDEAAWSALAELLLEHPATSMLWESEPLPAITERLNAAGISSVVFDPGGGAPTSGDFIDMIRSNAGALREAYGVDEER